MSTLHWQWSKFEELSNLELYEVMALRQRVFIVEQTCRYIDLDGKDQKCRHLLGWDSLDPSVRKLQAYLRVVPAGIKFLEISIGRVVTHPDARGAGYGKALMTKSLEVIDREFSHGGLAEVRISAQAYLEKFYTELGFRRTSKVPYLEDDIPHLEMLRSGFNKKIQ